MQCHTCKSESFELFPRKQATKPGEDQWYPCIDVLLQVRSWNVLSASRFLETKRIACTAPKPRQRHRSPYSFSSSQS